MFSKISRKTTMIEFLSIIADLSNQPEILLKEGLNNQCALGKFLKKKFWTAASE